MDSARQRIEETAVTLFNAEGYDAVSLREIAVAADTTIGNLTYHFHTKADLLEAVMSEPLEGYIALLDTTLKGHELLERFVDLFVMGSELAERYPFYFKLGTAVPVTKRGKNGQKKSRRLTSSLLSRELQSYYTCGLKRLRKDGYLSTKLSDWSLGVMASTIVTVESSWVLDAKADYTKNARPIGMADALCGVLLPAIEPQYRDEYVAICEKRGVSF